MLMCLTCTSEIHHNLSGHSSILDLLTPGSLVIPLTSEAPPKREATITWYPQLLVTPHRKLRSSSVRVILQVILWLMMLDLDPAKELNQADKFTSKIRSLVMSRDSILSSLDQTSKLLLDLPIQLLQKEESLQFLMKWFSNIFSNQMFSHSTWLDSKTKENTVSNLILHSVITIRLNSRVTFTGMISCSNICLVLDSTTLRLMENRSTFARPGHKVAWLPSTLELLSCPSQHSPSTQWPSSMCQQLTPLLSAKTRLNSVTLLLSSVAKTTTLAQMSGCLTHSSLTWPRADRRWNSKWAHLVLKSLLKLSQRV